MNMLKMCLNWKVLAGLAAIALGVYALAPGAFAAAAPLLLLAACPLSMLVMMKMMSAGRSASGDAGSPPGQTMTESGSRDEIHVELQRLQARQSTVTDRLDALQREERQDA